MSKYILSTMSAAQDVCLMNTSSNGSLSCYKKIHIKGGANVADKHTLATPTGIVTELSDEDYEALIKTDIWQKWLNRGFVKPVETKAAGEDATAEGLKEGDGGISPTEEDFKGSIKAGDSPMDISTGETPIVRRGRKSKGAKTL